ncbi:protein phosphatase 2C domain-containing protein [Trueperella sp. LYQ143]|uniref:PP2C family protein-serine/threonine phosphatase n=1 Tax=unclassified Trueperella TaxID=2630174 RepID=UPI00398356EB
MTLSLRYAALSDVGLVRSTNQDAGYASNNLLVLADGMGGAAGGDIASSVVVGHLARIDDIHQAEDLLSLLHTTLEEAHSELIERAEEQTELAGLGTTCIAILRSSNKLAMAHIGDSRAYLLRENALMQITKDHTLVQYLLDHGEITAEEAANHPKRNVIMRNIGDTPEPLDIDASLRVAIPGDRWLLCSDGLFGVVSDERIAQTLIDYPDVDACTQELIDLALAGGAPDNVTVIVADIVDDDTEEPHADRGPLIVGSAAIDAAKPTRGGQSAAAQAAALRRSHADAAPDNEIQDDDAPAPTPLRRIWARLGVTIVILLVLLGAGFGSYSWSQRQYYVSTSEGYLAIFQGVPNDLGPIKLSHLHTKTTIRLTDLAPVAQSRLDSPITRGSLEEAEKVIADLAAHERDSSKDPAGTNPAPSNTPSPSVYPPTENRPGTTPTGGTAPSGNTPSAPSGLPTSRDDATPRISQTPRTQPTVPPVTQEKDHDR